jgi:predicted nucleic acid-binding protein
MMFLDANIFISFLSGDDPERVKNCLALFERIAEGEAATTSEVVIAEVAYVLSSPRQYRLTSAQVVESVRPLLLLRGMKLPNKRRLLRALTLYATNNLDFEDCLTAAQIEQQNIPSLMSYDRGFDRLDGIPRQEP